MSENQTKLPGAIGKKVRLFLLIFVVLLVPMAMDQAELDRETVRWVGRVAAGVVILLTVYGLFAKLFKVIVFVILGLVALVFLVAEGHVKAPRVTEWFSSRQAEPK